MDKKEKGCQYIRFSAAGELLEAIENFAEEGESLGVAAKRLINDVLVKQGFTHKTYQDQRLESLDKRLAALEKAEKLKAYQEENPV